MKELADQTKTGTRDYKRLSGTAWSLWDVMYGRRSYRKYVPAVLPAGLAAGLDEVIALSTRVRGAPVRCVKAFTDPALVERIRVGLQKGALNKINFRVARTSPSGFLLMEVPEEDLTGDRPQALPAASLVMEDAVLWLAEKGLGSCWLGGVNQKELATIAGAGAGASVPIAIPFGTPSKKASTASGSTPRAVLARKRKLVSAVAFIESMDAPYEPPADIDAQGFEASAVQDIGGLLEQMIADAGAPGSPAALPGLLVEACFEAGRVAPSAGNSQPWSFIAVMEPERLEALEKACASGGWRAAIVVVAQPSSWRSALAERPFWMIDGPIALSHISLMAASASRAVRVLVNGFDEGPVAEAVRAHQGNRVVGVAFMK